MAHDLVTGGVAMSWQVGFAGGDVRADVQITAEPAPEFGSEISSTISPLYDEAIAAQTESIARQFGRPPVRLHCVDSGALPFTWAARLTAIFSMILDRAIEPSTKTKVAPQPGMRRSRLYVPGNTPKLIPNASIYGADAIILDLEESVAPQRKFEALAMVVSAIEHLDWSSSELMVRVNAGDQGRVDMHVLASAPVTTFILPKVETADEIAEIDQFLNDRNSDVLIFPLIESALGVENAFAIANASKRVTALSLGLEDYTADLGATRTEGQSESFYARSRILNAARAAGITPLASVFPNFSDAEAVTHYARTAKESGYEGVGCIHPNQIEPTHLGFAPSDKEREDAEAIVAAFESASEQSSAVVAVNGKMVDLPTYNRALRIVRSTGGSR